MSFEAKESTRTMEVIRQLVDNTLVDPTPFVLVQHQSMVGGPDSFNPRTDRVRLGPTKTVLGRLITLAICFLAFAAFSIAADTPDGAAIYKSKCVMCHGADGKGYAAVKTPDFTDPKVQASLTDKQIADIIKNGRPNTMMMPFGNQLKDDEIQALVTQIRSYKPKPRSTPKATQ